MAQVLERKSQHNVRQIQNGAGSGKKKSAQCKTDSKWGRFCLERKSQHNLGQIQNGAGSEKKMSAQCETDSKWRQLWTWKTLLLTPNMSLVSTKGRVL